MRMEVTLVSDVYLDLKARIPVVARTKFTTVDAALLDRRRKQLGLTHLDVATELGFVERTWMRWLERGSVPTRNVKDVARILQLDLYEDIDSPAPMGEGVNGSSPADRLESIEAAVFELASQLERAVEEVRTRLDRIHTQLGHIEDRLGDEDGQESSPNVSH